MRLTVSTDYAVRVLMYVAQRPERLCTIAEIARAYQISEAHLMKVTHRLGQHGWLATLRGKHGGVRLALAPAQIGLGSVVRAMEPDFALVECFAQQERCSIGAECRLKHALHGAMRDFFSHLDAYSLADLLPGAGPAPGAPSAPQSGASGRGSVMRWAHR